MRIACSLTLLALAAASPSVAQSALGYWGTPNNVVSGEEIANAAANDGSLSMSPYLRSAPAPDRERLIALLQTRDSQAILDFLGDRAAEGKQWAMLELGLAYARGSIVERDPVTSLNWFAEAANRGSGEAALVLGLAYTRGDILSPDEAKARAWLAKAAANGDYQVKRDAEKVLASF